MTTQAPPPMPDAEWLRRYEQECAAYLWAVRRVPQSPWQTLLRGTGGLASLKPDDAVIGLRLHGYRYWLADRCGRRTLYRVLPDGTTEEIPEWTQ